MGRTLLVSFLEGSLERLGLTLSFLCEKLVIDLVFKDESVSKARPRIGQISVPLPLWPLLL